MNKRSLLPVISGTLLCLISACNDSKHHPAPAYAGKPWQVLLDEEKLRDSWPSNSALVYQVMAEPPTLHPTNGNSSPWQEVIQYLHGFLLNIDFRHPGLESGILSLPEVSPDGLHYTYKMRGDARWDDGRPVTRRDVIFTLKASTCPFTANAFARSYWENLQSILPDPADSLKLTLVMKSPYIQNIGLLAEVPVLQENFYDMHHTLDHFSVEQFHSVGFDEASQPAVAAWARNFNDDRYGRDPQYISGLGPYKLTRWEAGQSLVLERKQHYWNHDDNVHARAMPEKIIFKLNRDDVSQKLEFKSQALDASSTITIKTLLDLCSDTAFLSNYRAAVMPTYNYTYLAMNNKPDGNARRKLFDDVRTRKAMARLVPVDELIKVVYQSYSPQCRRVAGPVSPMKKECDTTLVPIPYDVQEARKLLKEAGWMDSDGDGILDRTIDGQKISLSPELFIMNTSSDWKDMASLIVSGCRQAGIALTVVALDPKVFVEKARAHDFDMLLGVWGGTSHAEDYAQLWHTSSWTDHGNNYPGFGNAASDALIDSIKVTLDDERRASLVRRLQGKIYDDQPMVFLYASLRRYIVHKRFRGVELYAERPGILLNNLAPMLREETTP